MAKQTKEQRAVAANKQLAARIVQLEAENAELRKAVNVFQAAARILTSFGASNG